MRKIEPLLSATAVASMLRYDPDTGILTWIIKPSYNRNVGDQAGCKDRLGYITVGIKRKIYKAHRLAWLLQTGTWPDKEIDHIDGNPSNNRWDNLRLATTSQNQANQRRHRDNSTGFKGVSKNFHNGRYRARIIVNNKAILIGGKFDTLEEAHQAYVEAAKRLHGEFWRV
jgi:hypothetical protein